MIKKRVYPSNLSNQQGFRLGIPMNFFYIVLLALALLTAGVAAAPLPLSTTQNGTVSGDLYFGSYQNPAWNSQSSTSGMKEFTQHFTIPAFTNIQWARLETVVYAAGTDNRHGQTTVKFDGNGDGTYESTLGVEDQQTAASGDAEVYTVNGHMDRCYSDYRIWYDVTSMITAQNPVAYVKTENLSSSTFDGRVKEITLIVAYNDGDSDQVKYWVNTGHDYQASGASGVTTSFDTKTVPVGFTAATLKNVGLASKDALYTFNSLTPTGADPVAPYTYFETNSWDVMSGITAGSASTFGYTNHGGSFKTTIAALTVRCPAPPQPDFNVTVISPNVGAGAVLFANEPNVISVTVKNNGPGAASASTLGLDVAGTTYTASVGTLASGESQTVTVTDTVSRAGSTSVTITATADSLSAVTESNEANNVLTSAQTVYNNGFKGKRFTSGSDMNTQAGPFDGHYGVVYSAGNSAYSAAGWTEKTNSWTSSDLSIPDGATITSARLYQGYTWDQTTGESPLWTMTFNGATVSPAATYKDRKGYGGYDYPNGLYVYDVTSQFLMAGNSATITPGAGNNNGIYGAYLIVVYQDPTTTIKKIWINDECDALYAGTARSATSDEATAFANFASVDTSGVANAQAIAILSSAGDASKSKFFFNSNEYTGFWSNYQGTPQIGFSTYDVTSALTSGANTAKLQSFDAGSGGDNMYAQNVILVVEKSTPAAPVATFSGTPLSGNAPLTVAFTDSSTGTINTRAWDFNNDGTVDSTLQSPSFSFTTAGSYSVNLTVTGPGGSNSLIKTNYITVSSAPPSAPVAGFSANVTAGLAPQTVQFTDASTGTVTTRAWDFNNDGIIDSAAQNPIYTYTTAGTYTVNLTVTGPGGSNFQIKTNYIIISAGKQPLTTVQSGTVTGDLYVGAYQPVPWNNQPGTPGVKVFTQIFNIPTNTGIQWARLYAVVYAAGTDSRAGRATIQFDGNGDGTFDTTLGTEDLAIPSASNGNVYWVNDHCNKDYSDYMMWYDVTNQISAQTVNARIQTENISGSNFDGRLKTLTLVVAYNTGGGDQVKYFVNQGHDYQGSSDSGSQTVFGTAGIASGWTQANLSIIHLSSKDAAYTFNTHPYTGANPVAPVASFVYNKWDATNNLTTGSDSTFAFTHASGSSYKTPLAFLTVRTTTPATPALSVVPPSGVQTVGGISQYQVVMNTLPSGLAGYDLVISLTNSNIGDIVGVSYPSWGALNKTTEISTDSFKISCTDLGKQVEPGANNVVLATVSIRGDSPGTTPITLSNVHLDADGGNSVNPEIVNGQATIYSPLVADFVADRTSGMASTNVSLNVNFTDKSTGNPLPSTWSWQFGNGASSTAHNPMASYHVPGNYSVNLTVGNAYNQANKLMTNYIIVTPFVKPFPGYVNLPTDTNSDYLIEDINGNGRLDYDDVVAYYQNMDWMSQQYDVGTAPYDFNHNGRIDYDDVVLLYWIVLG